MGLDGHCFILVGVGPIASARTARSIRANVAGVHSPMPASRGSRARATRGPRASAFASNDPALREEAGVAGVHVMAYRQSQYVADIGRIGVLRGRAPWRRDFVPNMQPVESLEAG